MRPRMSKLPFFSQRPEQQPRPAGVEAEGEDTRHSRREDADRCCGPQWPERAVLLSGGCCGNGRRREHGERSEAGGWATKVSAA